MEHALAIDIGGTKIATGVVTAGGVLRGKKRADTPKDPAHALEVMTELVRASALEAGALIGREPLACGVACPGPLDVSAGVVATPPNLPAWHGFALRAALARALGVPVHLENDANAAALGEQRFGAGRGVDDLVYVTVSTGIGSGAVSNGLLVRGARGNAGEIGHGAVAHGDDAWPCACGLTGCVEAFASGPAVLRRAIESGVVDDGAGPDAVLALVKAGDPRARALWQETVEVLARGLATAVHAFDPAVIIVGGGFALAAGTLLWKPLHKAVLARVMPAFRGVRLEKAVLGDDAGLIGAGAIGLSAGV